MKILLLNQCFHPDVASTAQHLTDLAVGLAEREHAVTVVASQRGYDNPAARFPKRETWRNIKIIRIPSLGLGKSAKWRRAASFGSYLVSCTLQLVMLPRFDVVVAMTSPPLISFLGALFVRWKGGHFVFWVMDLNPDEAIAAGWLKPHSVVTRILEKMLRYSLRQAEKIVVLDRFMKERIVRKGIATGKIAVIRPWSHDDVISYDSEGRQAFRERHGLVGKYVVMYSGNHSPCHPLETLLRAAKLLESHPRIVFCFVGGGSEFPKVQQFARDQHLANITCLPYQPLDQLSASLSSADMHVVVMGDAFTGIVHPCKIYNILILGLPVLVVGPAESHIGDVLCETNCNGQAHVIQHGAVPAVVEYLLKMAACDTALPRKANDRVAGRISKSALMPQMIEMMETIKEST
jgi:putative colanic acid biosynthesis glycosyltransferase WcaI